MMPTNKQKEKQMNKQKEKQMTQFDELFTSEIANVITEDLFEDLHNEPSPPENIPPAAQTAIDSFKADIAGQEAWLRTPALTACSWVVGRDGIFVSAILDENKNTTGEHRINVNPLDATRYSRETANKLAAVTNNGNGQMQVYTLHEAVNEALDANRKAVQDLIKLFRDAAKN